jgi:hypothetical protein
VTKKLLTEIDEAIARLQKVRAFLIRNMDAAKNSRNSSRTPMGLMVAQRIYGET